MEAINFYEQQMFDYLVEYGGAPNERHTIQRQQEAYDCLVEAYKITESWAKVFQQRHCPNGFTSLRKSPVNQGNHFFTYNWAKIYPSRQSPKELAITVGIASDGAFLKIDTVNASKELRAAYLDLRGDYMSSPLVKYIPTEKLLEMTFDELLYWSSAQSGELITQYAVLAEKLGLVKEGTMSVTEPLPSQYEGSKLKRNTALNTILYGPPGTGKTYHTIEASVKAAEPEFYSQLKINAKSGANREQRIKLQQKYQELCDSKRIRFVTFHQSYGYEEFVEGLSANSVDGLISYEVKSGIFKTICEQAIQGVELSSDPLEIAISGLKTELEEGASLSLTTQRGKTFDIQYHGNTTFRAFPHETSHDDFGNGYPVAIDSIRKLYRGIDAREFYNPSYVKAILKYLIKQYKLPEKSLVLNQDSKNFVLVIDEINRGNISKIFGELITLIEDSKRSGKDQTETIEVVLPHSGDKFCVPDNLYIIGTMNTADRSLAMMDTALRRRFDFIEMMPNPSLLRGAVVKGIDLERLLTTLNERIEILYDREHTLGHAFFMPVKDLLGAVDEHDKEEEAFAKLVSVFQNKVVPLLQEYFFEDWQKIRLVLGDNQRESDLQLIETKELKNNDLDALFGKKHDLNPYGEALTRYKLKMFDKPVWQNAEVYRRMYAHSTKNNDAVIAQGETSTEDV